jgi:amino acid adenylation domain-containing protein
VHSITKACLLGHLTCSDLHVDVPVFDILACKSINALLSRVLTQLNTIHKSENAPILPEPVHYAKGSVEFRPISHSQQRMWFLQHYLEEKTINNLLLESEVTGKVHTDSFSKAWTVFVQRHESLHSCIVNTPRGLQQLPIQNHYFPFSITETSSDSFEKTCKEVRHVLRSHIYDLEAGNLVQGRLVRSSSGQTRFFLASHHIAWDRASVKTIFNETAAIYKAIQRGDDALLFMDSDPYQFIDYTLWQNTLLSEESFVEPHLKYWTKQLENLPISVSFLPTALVQSRPEFKRHSFDEVDLVFDAGSTILLHRFCQQSSITPFMLVTSTLALLISRLTGDQDVVIGIADSDRGHSAFDDLVGFTVNLLAIRARFETNDTSYLDFLEKYRQTCLEAYRHRALPFDVLLHKLNIPRSTSHSQAFQIVVNYQTAGGFKDCDYGDFKLTNYSHYNARPQSDFRLEVEETSSGELQCLWTYDVSLYSKETMTQVAERFRGLMKEALSSNPQTKLSDFFIPQIRAINASTEIYFKDTGSSSLKHLNPNKSHFAILFDQAVSKHPGKAAITDSERSITYEELGLYVARIETHLRSLGLQPGTSIGICCPPDTHLAVAMYGIVHAGLAYVPIDIDFPQERIISMIQDAGIRTILTGNVEMSQMANLGIEVDFVKLDELLGVEEITNAEIQSQDSATSHRGFCTIFTSGTTGRPKGIVVGHQQLRCQMQSYHDYLKTNESDIMLLASSITFDMSLTSIYGSILRGASLVIASREMRYSPQQLLEFVVKNKVTNCALTTTQLKFLLLGNSSNFSRWTSLKSLVVGGEEVPPWVAADFYALGLPDATLYNGYGPAETTVCNALNKIVASDCNEAALSIGSPLFPARFDLLDEELNKVPHGYEGELCIGGEVVNEGYMNHEDLTATAFIEDPIRRTNFPNSSIGKLYRTGDRARMGDDGRFYILGRINGDRQVKIRGMRTDLDEIESATLKALKCLDKEMFGISLVAVVCDKDQLLTAYLMAEEWRVETAIGKQELIRTLRLRLRASLLTHMIPRHFCIVLNIPQTPSGKTDYKALQAMPLEGILALNEAHSLDIRITPSSVEMKLAAIWKNVLHLKAEPSLEDDFFSLGGHSLILLDVQREMFQQFQVKVSLVDIFTNSSFQSLVKLVSTRLPEDVGSIASAHRMSEDESGSEILCTPETEPVEDVIDWAYEARLPLSVHHLNSEQHHSEARQNIIIVGACTMAGSHLLSHLLATVSTKIYCIGVNCPDDFNTTPKSLVVKELDHWGLPHYDLDRVVAYHGSLSQEALGLSEQQILKLKATVGSIYIMDSEVSLLKGYEDLRLSNVESLRFLVQLAFGNATAPAMETHYLSTWGVPHLQAWNDTKMMSDGLVKIECEMAHMEPSSEGSLGYLKARWVCEKLLCSAAREGLPVTIYRSCMCGSSRDSSTPLDKGDINRRILEGILQTGLVPDFGSAEGGGMSWISADFLVQSMCFLAQQPREILKQARFYHIVAEDHVPYTELAALLEKSHEGRSLVTVSPSEWFRTLRSGGTVDMVMHAEVLETWVNAGWLPFQMDAESTLCLLRKHGIVPPIVDKNFLQKHVIGDIGF